MKNKFFNLLLLVVSLIFFFYYDAIFLKVIFAISVVIIILQMVFHKKISNFENKIDSEISEEMSSGDTGHKIPFITTQIVLIIEVIVFLFGQYVIFFSHYAIFWKILAVLVSIFISGKWMLTYRIAKQQQKKSP